MGYRLVTETPVPIWSVTNGHIPDLDDEPVFNLFRNLQRVNGKRWIAFRGVPIERLGAILTNGVDVEPTDSPIFCAIDEEKALEYGKSPFDDDAPQVLYALHGAYLERTFRTLPADASPDAIAAVRKDYPYQYDVEGDYLHFSRLANQVNLAYEAHAYWVPRDAKKALLAVFVIGASDAVDAALRDYI